MMSFDKWLACIIDGARNIASRDYQEEAWFPNQKFFSSPGEVYEVLMEDCTADLFFETYGNAISDAQMQSWKELKLQLQRYYDKMPPHPDPRSVLEDPEWALVRQAAQKFVTAFSEPAGGPD
jgi:hypothetical protein